MTIVLGANWYRDIILFRTHNKGTDVTFGIEKSLDEKFKQDLDLWDKLPIWEVQRFINCIALDKPLVHDM
jgi:hypothetical protein